VRTLELKDDCGLGTGYYFKSFLGLELDRRSAKTFRKESQLLKLVVS